MDTITAPTRSRRDPQRPFLTGQGFAIVEAGVKVPVRVLASNRKATRSLIAQDQDGHPVTRWVDDELIVLADGES